MIQNLTYTTYSAVPSDYACADGHLATALGVIYEKGELRPVLQPAQVLRIDQGSYVTYIHKATAYTHYIVNNTYEHKIYWVDSKDIDPDLYPTDPHELFSYDDLEIRGFNSVGNTLVILTDDGMYYFLWKSDENDYLSLGNHMPELPISFGLQGTMYRNYSDEYDDDPDEMETFEITYSEDDDDKKKLWDDDKSSTWGDAKKSDITAQVLAKVNKFIANRATNKGRFIFPFFVRYAYRLYDDNLTMHSAPILMAANSKCAPVVGTVGGDNQPGDTSATLQIFGMVHDLDYMIEGISQGSTAYIDDLKRWSDIIKSVDIYISAPLYTYDQSGECEKFTRSYSTRDNDYGFCVCKADGNSGMSSQNKYFYRKWTINGFYDAAFGSDVCPAWHVELPNREETELEEVRDIANFYLLKTIPLDDLPTENARTKIEIKDDYLPSLVTRERMTDDYDSHDYLRPYYAFAYNSRLNTANFGKKLFEGFHPYTAFNFDNIQAESGNHSVQYYIHINYEAATIIIKNSGTIALMEGEPLLYFYYPSTDAVKITLLRDNKWYEIPLTTSDFLNGSYCFADWDDLPSIGTEVDGPTVTDIDTIDLPNKIYTSEVNNPYYFPLAGINTVGTGQIMGICAAAKPLSQGQFGDFPLYAFCTDGVWALSVSAEGLYSAIQPITRDVCINTDSITQLDSQVLFATDRGIMLISGSALQCITDSINSPAPFSPSHLPQAYALEEIYNEMAPEKIQIDDINYIDMMPFLDFLATCRMIYDYIHQRIIVYNRDALYAYVFSLESQAWGMMLSRTFSSVNSYPDAMAMANVIVNGHPIPTLVDYSHPTDTSTSVLLVTRPFTLGAPAKLKTIRAIYQHGYFPKLKGGPICQVLYGTPDLFNWYVVASSVNNRLTGINGTPYKAFRLAVVALLEQDYTITNAEIDFDIRLANRIR